MTGPSQGETTGDSGRSSVSFAANHAPASYPLAESGILFDMVGSDQNVPGGILATSQEKADADTVPESSLVAAVATAACGVMIGAFVASLALGHQVQLENGQLMPSVSWLHSFGDWLPWLCIGFGLSGLVAYRPDGRIILRGLGIFAVFLSATWLASAGPGQEWLSGYVACVIGAVFGLHRESMRRIGAAGVVIAGAGAAIASFAVLAVPLAVGNSGWCVADVLGVGLCASFVAFLLEAPSIAAAPGFGGHWRRALLCWISVAMMAVYILMRATADEWVMLSAVLAVVITALAAGRPALALGATLATVLLAGGSSTDLWSSSVRSVGEVRVELDGQTDRTQLQILRDEGLAQAVYVASSQELQLHLAGEIVAAAGPDRSEEPLLKAILHAVVRDGDRVLLFGNGTGRVKTSLLAAGRCEVECATAWPELAALQSAVQVDGPVQPPHVTLEPRPDTWRKALADIPTGSRQVIVLGELPTLATSHRATESFQRQLRRVVGDGVVCQPIALDRISVSMLDDWLAAVGQIYPWSGIYAVANAAVLVSSSQKPIWREGFLGWSDEARWAMHDAHLIGPEDLEVAYLGKLQPEIPSVTSALAGSGVAHQLLNWLALPEPSPSIRRGSLLRRWQSQYDDMLRAKNRFLTLANDAAGRAEAQAIAARFLPRGAPAPWLQAALGLAGDDGVTLREPGLASRCAYAMDPSFFVVPATVFSALPLPNRRSGDLEDIFRLDDGERLVRRCVGSGPQAVALRARFASRCARSLIAELLQRPLGDDESMALRELSDPFVLREAATVLVSRGRWHELLSLWRADLPMPNALKDVARNGSQADQKQLASALQGRRDPSCYGAIADLLESESLEIRLLAGEALHLAIGDRVLFDARWPRSRRLDAATRLRGLHNRKP